MGQQFHRPTVKTNDTWQPADSPIDLRSAKHNLELNRTAFQTFSQGGLKRASVEKSSIDFEEPDAD